MNDVSQSARRLCAWQGMAALAILAAPGLASGQPAKTETEDATKANEASLGAMKAMASRYELFTAAEQPVKLQRTAEPVQRWTNPIRGQVDGCLYLWTLDGRPQAALTIYPALDPRVWNNEFQSLATTPLVAKFDGEEAWTPDQPGVEFKLVPDSPPPADTATRRLTQMRSIARGIGATVDFRGDKSELRLLTAPIYRYGKEGTELFDGAAFVFAQATDPELLLIVETRLAANKLQWHYALARLTQWPLAATYNSQPVWSVERWIRAKSHPKQTYFDRPRREE